MVNRAQLSALILVCSRCPRSINLFLAQYTAAKDISIQPNVFTAPPPVIYGQGVNSFGSGTLQQVIRTGLPLAQSVIGGGIGSAVPGVLDLAQGYLPENLQQYAGLLTPVLQGALSGSGGKRRGLGDERNLPTDQCARG